MKSQIYKVTYMSTPYVNRVNYAISIKFFEIEDGLDIIQESINILRKDNKESSIQIMDVSALGQPQKAVWEGDIKPSEVAQKNILAEKEKPLLFRASFEDISRPRPKQDVEFFAYRGDNLITEAWKVFREQYDVEPEAKWYIYTIDFPDLRTPQKAKNEADMIMEANDIIRSFKSVVSDLAASRHDINFVAFFRKVNDILAEQGEWIRAYKTI